MRFDFIHAERANFSISALCRVLEVTRAGYYAYLARPVSPRVANEVALQSLVRGAFDQSEGRYGSPRVRHQLRREGHAASKRAVERTARARARVRKKHFRVQTRLARR